MVGESRSEAGRVFLGVGQFFTGAKEVIFAFPVGENQWLWKSGRLQFVLGTLVRAEGIKLTTSPATQRVSDSFHCVNEFVDEGGQSVSKVIKWVFQDGVVMQAECLEGRIDG